MSILYLLVPLALFIAMAAVGAFIWAIRSGEFDDLETPAIRVLFDEDAPAPPGAPTTLER
ncbi:MAG: cbb3-type cytochrome oxidase assembly protein CcoS [Myxococcota bacterium]